MLYDLLLDIGNSAIKAGLNAGDHIEHVRRIERGGSDLGDSLARFVGDRPIRRVGMVSVVPEATEAVRHAVVPWSGAPFVVQVNGPLPFRLAYRTPKTLGLDRLAAAAAAWVRYGQRVAHPVVAIDAGTAITAEVVAPGPGDSHGATYLGGVIAPGLRLLARSLAQGTAQLPLVDVSVDPEPIGTSTHTALTAGIDAAFVGSVREVMRRIARDLGQPPLVVLTGGDAERLMQPLADYTPTLAPHLVLEGVAVLQAFATRA